ncbi:MAG: M48 family metallopeptidase [Bacteroidales bacterium]|nr:M48 family metallopeptidase [Bacteroidales bacterium]MDD3200382.1 M48 family metallopeptidase [Bacteroidales bacterium]
MSKIIKHPELGEVFITKRVKSRRLSIRVNSKGEIRVSIPWLVTYSRAMSFVEDNKEWIIKQRTSRKNRPSPMNGIDVEAIRNQAKATLPARLKYLADLHGFTYNKVFIKNNVSNWGSCSAQKNINLNLRLVLLSQELIDYVILHELCHLKYLNHGKEFHLLLNTLVNGREKELRKKLRQYRIR